MKPPTVPPHGSSGTAGPGDRPWRVELHRAVAKTIAAQGGIGADIFRPSIGELIAALETDPKRFPKKKGKLEEARAAAVTYADGIVWRAIYTIDEEARSVRVIALGPHDDAYDEAKRRI